MNKAIVIGGDHHNTLGVIRGLGEKGIRPDLILVKKEGRTFVDSSRYINKSWRVSTDVGVIDVLLNHYSKEDSKPVVICCSDQCSGIIDDNYDKLKGFFILPGASSQGVLSNLMNKRNMGDLANEIGLRIPHTSYVNSTNLDYCNIVFPCIIKPIVSRKGKKTEIAICNTLDEIKTYATKHIIENYQIQDFIDKEFEYQLIGCSTKEEIIIPGVSKILRPCKGSNTSFLHYTPLEEGFCDIEKCKDFVRRTGYHGLFSLEFLRDKRGKDYFMEINFRNDGNAICVTAAGVNLPFIWYLDCIGADYSQEKNKAIRSIYVMPDMAELKLLMTRQISLREFITDFRKTNRFMEYDKHDTIPFWKMITNLLCSKIRI